jgi:MraZ protein
VAARFFGQYEHSLDVKGRVILPARFRSHFDTVVYASPHHERCLALWAPDGFERKSAEMEELQDRSADDRNMARFWASASAELELDRQGRVALPHFLREFARLDGQLLVVGAFDHIEIWNPAEWAQRVLPSEATFVDPPGPGVRAPAASAGAG